MNFDYTYIFLFGFQFFEPMVLLTNAIFFTLCLIYFIRISKYKHDYAKQMGLFMLVLGTSSIFGAICHTVHMQLGEVFFKVLLFFMNAFSLFSIYYCFRAAYTYYTVNKKSSKIYIYCAMASVGILLLVSGILQNFTIIKVSAGVALVYSLIVHYIKYKKTNEKGPLTVVVGILISFLPILVHSFKIKIHEWFNHKDLAHVIMIVSLVVIYKGAKLISEKLSLENPSSN